MPLLVPLRAVGGNRYIKKEKYREIRYSNIHELLLLLLPLLRIIQMSDILRDLSQASMAHANEANQYASTPFLYNLPGAEVYKGDDVSWCITDIPASPCNVVFNARLKPDYVDSVIKSVIEKARTKYVPIRWYVGRNTEPADLGESLVSHGFITDGPAPMMAVDLQTLKEDTRTLSGLNVIEVKDTDNLKIWTNVASRGFGGTPQSEIAHFRWFSAVLELGLPMRFYLAVHNGVPVATSQLLLAEGVAGIDRVATVPEARNQGIGYAITLHPLLEAREMGYQAGTIQANEAGARVYHRMGFWKCGEITTYHWWNRPPGA